MNTCPKCEEPCRPDQVKDGECIWCVSAGRAKRRQLLAAVPQVMLGPTSWGGSMFVHHDPEQPTLWRVTYLRDEEPIGHHGPAPFVACIEDCSYNGDTDLLKPAAACAVCSLVKQIAVKWGMEPICKSCARIDSPPQTTREKIDAWRAQLAERPLRDEDKP